MKTKLTNKHYSNEEFGNYLQDIFISECPLEVI